MPRSHHEYNFPANLIMLIDSYRYLHKDVAPEIDKLFDSIQREAQLACMQLKAINDGRPLNSVDLNTIYNAGWRFSNDIMVKPAAPKTEVAPCQNS
jgi:hypothetical protein